MHTRCRCQTKNTEISFLDNASENISYYYKVSIRNKKGTCNPTSSRGTNCLTANTGTIYHNMLEQTETNINQANNWVRPIWFTLKLFPLPDLASKMEPNEWKRTGNSGKTVRSQIEKHKDNGS